MYVADALQGLDIFTHGLLVGCHNGYSFHIVVVVVKVHGLHLCVWSIILLVSGVL